MVERQRKGVSPESFAVAARIGLDGVQLDFGRVKESNARLPLFDEAHQDRILAAAAEHKVQISSCALVLVPVLRERPGRRRCEQRPTDRRGFCAD